MSSLTDLLSQVGGAAGTLGSAVAGYLATQIKSIRTSAKRAREAYDGANLARAAAEAARDATDSLVRGVRLEIEHFRSEIQVASLHRPQSQPAFTPVDPNAPTMAEVSRRLEDLAKRIDECKVDIARERNARHLLQRTLADEGREEERQWREIHRILGEIQGELRANR